MPGGLPGVDRRGVKFGNNSIKQLIMIAVQPDPFWWVYSPCHRVTVQQTPWTLLGLHQRLLGGEHNFAGVELYAVNIAEVIGQHVGNLAVDGTSVPERTNPVALAYSLSEVTSTIFSVAHGRLTVSR